MPDHQNGVGRPRDAADYDHAIHSSPDALEWAKFFCKTWVEVHPDRPVPDQDWIHGWFANAMMAMSDHVRREQPDNGWRARAVAAEEILVSILKAQHHVREYTCNAKECDLEQAKRAARRHLDEAGVGYR